MYSCLQGYHYTCILSALGYSNIHAGCIGILLSMRVMVRIPLFVQCASYINIIMYSVHKENKNTLSQKRLVDFLASPVYTVFSFLQCAGDYIVYIDYMHIFEYIEYYMHIFEYTSQRLLLFADKVSKTRFVYDKQYIPLFAY